MFCRLVKQSTESSRLFREHACNSCLQFPHHLQGSISVFNNGQGIPIEMHKEEKMYVPELIFGHLLTSSNYDDSQAKTTGGRNGCARVRVSAPILDFLPSHL
jgi:DNA gyrase/topoisomerase IV subunit B